ncbi:hypothetical protein [Photorhabdus hindustanensis]|uniref:Glycosyltransferase n=1 Tax=Photorhabdus hindustanensis TaxID=2918802 RepID=A0A2S8Q885_9GAMM|nr:hypothetical protein [Photorhabdus hindustanensis]PQQ29154.1 hypothetical protein C6H66_02440 [Photorhabdus hindustanensis]
MTAFITRNNPQKHPVLISLISAIEKLSNSKLNIIEKKLFSIIFFHSHSNLKDKKYIFVDDPITFIYCNIYLKVPAAKIILYSLEMYEYQVDNNKIKNKIRNLIFYVTHIYAQKKANKIIFPSESRFRFYLNNKNRLFLKEKSKIIYNYPDSNTLTISNVCKNKSKTIKDLKDKGKKIVIYAGSIQKGRDIDIIAKSFAKLSNFHLILIGPIKENKNNHFDNLKNVSYFGVISRNEVNYFYSVADIGLLNYSNTPINTKFCAPVKLWEYLYFKLKIISNSNYAMQTEWKIYVNDFYKTGEDFIKILHASEKYESKHLSNIPFLEEEIASFIRKDLLS